MLYFFCVVNEVVCLCPYLDLSVRFSYTSVRACVKVCAHRRVKGLKPVFIYKCFTASGHAQALQRSYTSTIHPVFIHLRYTQCSYTSTIHPVFIQMRSTQCSYTNVAPRLHTQALHPVFIYKRCNRYSYTRVAPGANTHALHINKCYGRSCTDVTSVHVQV